ncbi:putative short chain dehydrogenase [Aspergillus eucalypticola CBS 122712]|uniref:Short chain dehydrogenase n=1 Tax=Aspergillus eucalypticola (strain CBS 122712 / IBT 29274) TaxID=1448314 RepID=A0A317UWF1_ASPEC|nr:putative short chain dehydrogenase [Aspergillus eucalypticola CBS 122712]PWY64847.1 putative short chain dehydrogenase [Aspergillus eucalypticola CBS 122712]
MTDSKIVFITGANTGIGYETVKALLKSVRRYVILLGTRSLVKGEAAIESLRTEVPDSSSTVHSIVIDVVSDESIEAAFKEVEVRWGRVDSLINNAGAEFSWEFKAGKLTRRELLNKTFDVNVSGAYIVTETFMPLLLRSSDARIIFISSGQASLTAFSNGMMRLPPLPAAGWPKEMAFDATAYRSAKAALNMMMLNISRMLRNDKVKVWGVSPGFLKTGLGNMDPALVETMGAKDPSIGGIFIKDVVEGLKDADVGKVVHAEGHVQDW